MLSYLIAFLSPSCPMKLHLNSCFLCFVAHLQNLGGPSSPPPKAPPPQESHFGAEAAFCMVHRLRTQHLSIRSLFTIHNVSPVISDHGPRTIGGEMYVRNATRRPDSSAEFWIESRRFGLHCSAIDNRGHLYIHTLASAGRFSFFWPLWCCYFGQILHNY